MSRVWRFLRKMIALLPPARLVLTVQLQQIDCERLQSYSDEMRTPVITVM